jgi:hypothetical protein
MCSKEQGYYQSGAHEMPNDNPVFDTWVDAYFGGHSSLEYSGAIDGMRDAYNAGRKSNFSRLSEEKPEPTQVCEFFYRDELNTGTYYPATVRENAHLGEHFFLDGACLLVNPAETFWRAV